MKKNLALMMGLFSIILLAGCGGEKVENSDVENPEVDVVVNEENAGEVDHPEWVATSLSVEDLERIESSMPPLSYDYSTFDMESNSIVNSGSYSVAEGEEATFFIPEYATMTNREVTSSGIEDDMIYTMTNVTLQDGTELKVLYVNEPSTLFCRAIAIDNGNLSTLYSNFVYAAEIE